jgi:uncharacterized protein (UPF0128 family)
MNKLEGWESSLGERREGDKYVKGIKEMNVKYIAHFLFSCATTAITTTTTTTTTNITITTTYKLSKNSVISNHDQ